MQVHPHAGAGVVGVAGMHLPVDVVPAAQQVDPLFVELAHGHTGGGGAHGGGGGADEQVLGGSGTGIKTSPELHLPDLVTGPGLQHLDPDLVGWGHMHCGAGTAAQVPSMRLSGLGQHVFPLRVGQGQLLMLGLHLPVLVVA